MGSMWQDALLEKPTSEWFKELNGRGPGESRQLLRLKNTTWEEFAYHVRRGQPLVVEDAARDWPFGGWGCRDFGTAYPTGHMKAECVTSVNARCFPLTAFFVFPFRGTAQIHSRAAARQSRRHDVDRQPAPHQGQPGSRSACQPIR